MKTNRLFTAGALLIGVGSAASAQVGATYANPAPAQYLVTVNTAGLVGQVGYLDFVFSPGPAGSVTPATVTVTGFQTNGAPSASGAADGGAASGSLPGSLTLQNTSQSNDVYQGFTFGTTLRFTATFSGLALTAPSGNVGDSSTFGLVLYDGADTPQLTSADDASVADITLNPDASLTTQTYQTAAGGSPAADITPAPEPSEWAAFSLGAVGLAALGLRARPRRAV